MITMRTRGVEEHSFLDLHEKARLALSDSRTVIIDLTIPGGMGGEETLKKLLKIDPNVVSIVSSGYADVIPDGFRATMPKPYSLEKLDISIRKAIFKG